VLAVSQDQPLSELTGYLAADKYLYPGIPSDQGGSKITKDYGNNAWPTMILIGPNKKVVEKKIWPVSTLTATLKKYPLSSNDIHQTVSQDLFDNIRLNPVKNSIQLSVPFSGYYTLNVYSSDGTMVREIFNGSLAPGEHVITWNKGSLAKGVYIITLSCGDVQKKTYQRTIVHLRTPL